MNEKLLNSIVQKGLQNHSFLFFLKFSENSLIAMEMYLQRDTNLCACSAWHFAQSDIQICVIQRFCWLISKCRPMCHECPPILLAASPVNLWIASVANKRVLSRLKSPATADGDLQQCFHIPSSLAFSQAHDREFSERQHNLAVKSRNCGAGKLGGISLFLT